MPFYTQIHMLVVHEAVPARNAAEFVVLARAQLGVEGVAAEGLAHRAEGLALQLDHAFAERDHPLRSVHGFP